MKPIRCLNCGANDMVEVGSFWVCRYCQSKFAIESSDVPREGMGVSLNADIQRLLRKCKEDPRNAKKYANLILDIDPTNREALKYL